MCPGVGYVSGRRWQGQLDVCTRVVVSAEPVPLSRVYGSLVFHSGTGAALESDLEQILDGVAHLDVTKRNGGSQSRATVHLGRDAFGDVRHCRPWPGTEGYSLDKV